MSDRVAHAAEYVRGRLDRVNLHPISRSHHEAIVRLLRVETRADGIGIRPVGSARTAQVRERETGGFVRAVARGSKGIFAGYALGEWDTDDLYGVMSALAGIDRMLILGRLLAPLLSRSSRRKAKELDNYLDVAIHYDLPPALFATFTDGTGYSATKLRHSPGSLRSAFRADYSDLLGSLKSPVQNRRVFDLGSGWGTLAQFIVENTAYSYHGVSISGVQIAYSRTRVQDPRAQFVEGNFLSRTTWPEDAGIIFMVESLEHVIPADRKRLFIALRDKYPAAPLVIQFTSRLGALPEVQNMHGGAMRDLIFTGPGRLPSVRAVSGELRRAGYRIDSHHDLSLEYGAQALHWLSNLDSYGSEMSPEVPAELVRLWRIYFASAAAALGSGIFASVRLVAKLQ